MSEKKDSFQHLTLSIVIASIYSTDFLDSTRKYLDTKMFTNSATRLIMDSVLNYYDSRSKAPASLIADAVNNYGVKNSKSQSVIDDANNVIMEAITLFNSGHLKDLDIEYISSRIIEYSYSTKFQNMIPELHKLSEKYDIQNLTSKLSDYLDTYNAAVSLEEDDMIYGGKDTLITDLYERNDIVLNEFTYGVRILDELNIRPIRKKITGLIGYYGRGKSLFIVGVACANALDPNYNKKVLIINGEQKSADIFKKIIQNYYGVNEIIAEHFYFTFVKSAKKYDRSVEYKKELLLNSLDLNTELEKLVEKHKGNIDIFKNIIIQSFKSKTITYKSIEYTLKKIKRLHDFVPDVIAIDHLCEIEIKDSKAERKELEIFLSSVRTLGDKNNCHIVVLHQPSSVNPVPDYLTWNLHSAENKGLARLLDVAITLNVTDAEASMGLGRLLLEKVKLPNGQVTVGKKILISQIPTLQRFSVDSHELSKGHTYDIDSPLEEESNEDFI